MKQTILFLYLFTISTLVIAQDSLVSVHLKQHLKTFNVTDGNWQGDGKDFLLNEAKNSQFFLIGEDHGIAEIPIFTTLLANELSQKAYNYGYFATEAGPITAQYLQEMAVDKKANELFAKTNQEVPWAIPFYTWKEEVGILTTMMQQHKNDQPRIWGLDQEFVGAPRILFPRLMKLAPNATAKELAKQYYEEAFKGFDNTIKTKNPQGIFMYQQNEEKYKKLREAFAENQEALNIIEEISVSQEIYQKFSTQQGFASNVQRAELMKKHFLAYYQTAKTTYGEEQPKVLGKFGASHIYRGANGLNAFDIGNFVSELASMEGSKSFHLYVIGRKGFQNAYTPFGTEEDKQSAYDAEDYLDEINFKPIFDIMDAKEWSVVDLRPLRELLFYKKIKNLDQGLEKLIWSYDAILVIPEVHAATNFD